jgi:hypothetical protein
LKSGVNFNLFGRHLCMFCFKLIVKHKITPKE